MLVNCAGTSVTGKFEDIEVNSFEVSEHTFLFYHMMISYLTIITIRLHSCVCRLEQCYPWLVLAVRISSDLQRLPLTSPLMISNSLIFFCWRFFKNIFNLFKKNAAVISFQFWDAHIVSAWEAAALMKRPKSHPKTPVFLLLFAHSPQASIHLQTMLNHLKILNGHHFIINLNNPFYCLYRLSVVFYVL